MRVKLGGIWKFRAEEVWRSRLGAFGTLQIPLIIAKECTEFTSIKFSGVAHNGVRILLPKNSLWKGRKMT